MEPLPVIPLQLAHIAFGRFLEVFRGDAGKPSKQDFLFFRDLSACCCPQQDRALWQKYTGIDFQVVDGFLYADPVSGALLVMMIRGSTDCDSRTPSENFRSYWSSERGLQFEGTCYPGLALEQVGKLLRVTSFARLSSRVSFQPLTPFVSMSQAQLYDLKAAEQGVRLCLALKSAVIELCRFYRSFGRNGGEQQNRSLYEAGVPYPLQCRAALLGARPRRMVNSRLVYVLLDVVVKYVQHEYGEAVHKAWAAAGLAPKLMSVEPLPGGWLQVTMEKLGDEWIRLQDHPRADEIRPKVLEALDRAHRVVVGMDKDGEPTYAVHGDMRDSNVMVKGDAESVKFIDFDWAKEEGGRYPPFMNREDIDWPLGVEDYKPMLQRHDKELLQDRNKRSSSKSGLDVLKSSLLQSEHSR